MSLSTKYLPIMSHLPMFAFRPVIRGGEPTSVHLIFLQSNPQRSRHRVCPRIGINSIPNFSVSGIKTLDPLRYSFLSLWLFEDPLLSTRQFLQEPLPFLQASGIFRRVPLLKYGCYCGFLHSWQSNSRRNPEGSLQKNSISQDLS